MKRETFGRLVRDAVPFLIERAGRVPVTNLCSGLEYERRLLATVKYKLRQLRRTKTRKAERMADLWDLLDAITHYYDLDPADVARVRQEKKDSHGGFDRGVVLLEVRDRVEI